MRRRHRPRRKWKGKFFMIMLTATIAASYFYSEKFHACYLRLYYTDFSKMTEKEMMKEAHDLFSKKQYPELIKLSGNIKLLYPDNKNINKLLGTALIKTGQKEKGVEILLSGSYKNIPYDLLEDVTKTLYEIKLYEDVIKIVSENDAKNNQNILYYLGMSFYSKGNYERAVKELSKAIHEGRSDTATCMNLAKAHINLKNHKEAITLLEKLKNEDTANSEIPGMLINLYQKTGNTKKAQRLLRAR